MGPRVMADVELLPLSQREVYDESFWQEGIAGGANVVTYNGEDVRGVCRIEDANTRRLVINQHNAAIRNTRANLAPLQAENERLRAEVEGLRSKAIEHRDGRLAALERAERLAEALRAFPAEPNPYTYRIAHAKARAALAQEDRND